MYDCMMDGIVVSLNMRYHMYIGTYMYNYNVSRKYLLNNKKFKMVCKIYIVLIYYCLE